MFRKQENGEDQVAIRRELAALISLPQHPNIVRYHHATAVNGVQFTICEYIHGAPLGEVLNRPHAQAGPGHILEWARQLLEGLSHLHQETIVHRDLHLYNIMVKYAAGTTELATRPGSLKIIDVGNSRLLESRNLQTVSNVGGDQSYHSPERLSGRGYNEKDDIWCVGVLLSELTTRTIVSRRRGVGERGVFFAHDSHQDSVATVIAETARVSRDLGAIVGRILLQRDPSERPSANDLLHEFFSERRMPLSFMCPLSYEVMRDPVMSADGHSYERECIQQWFDTGHDTSPMTGLRLANTLLTPNIVLRAAIAEMMMQM